MSVSLNMTQKLGNIFSPKTQVKPVVNQKKLAATSKKKLQQPTNINSFLPSGQKPPQTSGDPDAFDETIQDSQFRSI